MNYENHAIRFASMEWDTPQPLVRNKARVIGTKRLRLVEFRRGMEHPEWCTVGHVGYILEGRLAIEFEGGTIELEAGDGVVLPAGQAARHRPVPVTERVLLILVEDTEP